MKKLRSLFVVLILALITVCHANSMELKNIVMLGDSLSDNGNLFAVHGSYPPSPPYYQGRFSDGPVWFEYLTKELGVRGMTLNYSHGGAMTGKTNVNDESASGASGAREFPGFLDEVEAYLSVAAASKSYHGAFAMPEDTLFIIWIGANDFWTVTDAVAQITQAASNVQTGLSQLIKANAKQFVVITLPDLGKAPKFNTDKTLSAGASQLSAGYNQALGKVIAGMKAAYPNITIDTIDSVSMLSDIIDDAQTLGLTNTTDSKLNTSTGQIATDGNYLFWDGVHPTTFAHKLIAQKVAESLECENCTGAVVPNNMMPYFENGLTLKVPSAKFGNTSYGFTLIPYQNSAATGVYWKLDMTVPVVEVTPPK